jgi:uncharacterized protein (DUF58 family)
LRLNRFNDRITRGGMLFLLALLVTGAGAFLTGNNLLFLIFSAMLALLLVSGFLSRLMLAGLEIELLLAEHVFARTPTAARVRIRNLKRLTPSFSIELTGLGDPVYFPLIPGCGIIEAAGQIGFPRRGRHHENLFVISTAFPFGFLRKSTTVALRRETVVYPAVRDLEKGVRERMQPLLDSVTGELESGTRGEGRDFYRIRPYEPQDSARHVDWKSTAHTGGLQVREFTRDQDRAVEIFFDRRTPPGSHEQFENLVEDCAFVVWELAGRDARIWMRSQRGFAMAIPEEGDFYDLMRFLALVEPMVVRDIGALEDEPADPLNPRIVFSLARRD